MAVKKKIIINECGRFACQAYIESATALSNNGFWSGANFPMQAET